MEKEGKSQHLGFLSPKYSWPLSRCIQNWKTGSGRSRETCERQFDWRESKFDN